MGSAEAPKVVRLFLGLANYYQKFIRNFSKIVVPLSKFAH